MKSYYFTFGQDHKHVLAESEKGKIVLDRDIVAEVEAESYWEAREKLMTITGPKFAFQYEEKPNMEYYPRGVIELQITQEVTQKGARE